MKKYLAIDIGASSGRHIVGWLEQGQIVTREVYRFWNGVDRLDGHLTWNMERLEQEVRTGIDRALEQFPDIVSLSIDTWAVDYVLLQGKDPVLPCYAYRDNRTEEAISRVHEIIPFEELYARTGIQFQPFNTIYQLYADKLCGRLEQACGFLMIPEYLLYRLCGVKSHEYTNASTTGLVNAKTGQYDGEIIRALGLPQRFFKPLQQPGTVIGSYKGVKVVLCATHDTASAVEGIPMEGDSLFLSSGTWSLLGAKLPAPITTRESMEANFSNEGGVGYIRYLKNIMGMWLVNELKREVCPDMAFPEIDAAAAASSCDVLVDANGEMFLAPESMKAAFDQASGGALHSVGDYFRCAYRSLAKCYGQAIEEIETVTGRAWKALTIAGGGARNKMLNEETAAFTGKQVIALPIEATALGNLEIQMREDG